jgi:nitric oxide reductase subunit C
MRKIFFLLVLSLIIPLLIACGGGSNEGGGSAKAGEKLFKELSVNNQPGCSTCHSLEPDVILVGPSLAGIANRAGERVADLSAEEYLNQSIIDPDAYTLEGFQASVMPMVWSSVLSEGQVNDLVAFLMTLK